MSEMMSLQKIWSFNEKLFEKFSCWHITITSCFVAYYVQSGEFWLYIKFLEITLPLNQWRMLKLKFYHKILKSLIEWKILSKFRFSLIFNQNLMVPPSFVQILSGRIIKGKVFVIKRRFLFLYKKWCTEAYIRSRVHEYKVIHARMNGALC